MKSPLTVRLIKNRFEKLFVLGISTGLGLGLIPGAPGTFGSLLGIPLGLYLIQIPTWLALIICAGLFAIFSPLAQRACEHWGQSDCQKVVSDEVLGQALTLLCLRHSVPLHSVELFQGITWNLPESPLYILVGFGLFRVLDIVKPYPAKTFDRQGGGFAVIADDVVAGLYGALVLWAITRLKF